MSPPCSSISISLNLIDTAISASFDQYKPEHFNLSNMVKVQVSFQVVRVGRHDYVFIPKLRALCLLNRDAEAVCTILLALCTCGLSDRDFAHQDYNVAAIEAIAKAPVSPLKKIKRKVGYGDSTEEDSDQGNQPPQGAMKRLRLYDAPHSHGPRPAGAHLPVDAADS